MAKSVCEFSSFLLLSGMNKSWNLSCHSAEHGNNLFGIYLWIYLQNGNKKKYTNVEKFTL